MQAPVLSQAVAPQVASLVEQATVQQFPVPSMSQMPDSQVALLVHGSPSASRPPMPPDVVPGPPFVPPGPPVVPALTVPVVPPVVAAPVLLAPAEAETPLELPLELPVVPPEEPPHAAAEIVRPIAAERRIRTWNSL